MMPETWNEIEYNLTEVSIWGISEFGRFFVMRVRKALQTPILTNPCSAQLFDALGGCGTKLLSSLRDQMSQKTKSNGLNFCR